MSRGPAEESGLGGLVEAGAGAIGAGLGSERMNEAGSGRGEAGIGM